MKKLLSLFIVMLMVSAASAGIVRLEVNGEGAAPTSGDAIEVTAGSDIVINILADTGIFQIEADILGNAGTAKTPITVNTTFNTASPLASEGFIKNDGTQLITGIVQLCVQDFVTNVPAGEVLYSFTYTVPETLGVMEISGTNIYASFNDFSTSDSMQPVFLNVVPEPMTIALLGIGGLFLRRKK